MTEEKTKGINTGRIISIVVGAALVAALAFFVYKYYNEKNRNEVQEEHIEGMTAEIEDLETDLDSYKLDLENKDLDLEEKERLLAEKEQMLVEKQKRIDELLSQNKISKAAAERLKGKVEQLEYYIRKYQKEIEVLRTQLEEATEENKRLTGRLDTMKGTVNQAKRAADEKRLQLEAASILNAHTFEYYRIKRSGKEIKESEFRRGQMDEIKICFKINENLAAERGERDFYVQLIDTKGKVVRDGAGGQSGYFTYLDEEMPYTRKKTAHYDKSTMRLCVNFTEPADYEWEKGDHSVLVYADGYEIGKGSFLIK